MTYPQPLASQSVTVGQSVFRLNTLIDSAGDVYEVDVGCNALALGPKSEISLVQATYYNPLVTVTATDNVIISPDRPFIGRLDARNEQPYPATGKRGRILLTLDDNFDAGYKPVLIPFNNGKLTVYTPILDVMAYYGPPPSLIPQRSDRRYYWEYVQDPGLNHLSFVVLPYYGRKFASFVFTNWKNQVINVGIVGVNFTSNSNGFPSEKELLVSTGVAASGGTLSKVIRASADGMWDALCVYYGPLVTTGVGPIPTHVIMSDDAL